MRNDAPVSTQRLKQARESKLEGAYAQIAQVRTERFWVLRSSDPSYRPVGAGTFARMDVGDTGWRPFRKGYILRRRRARKHSGLLAYSGLDQGAGWSSVVVPLRTGSYQAGTREVQTDSGVDISARALLTFDGVQPRAPTVMC